VDHNARVGRRTGCVGVGMVDEKVERLIQIARQMQEEVFRRERDGSCTHIRCGAHTAHTPHSPECAWAALDAALEDLDTPVGVVKCCE